MYLYITPIMTMAFSVAVLNERLTPMSLAGVALILGGICFSERKKVMEAPDALESGAL